MQSVFIVVGRVIFQYNFIAFLYYVSPWNTLKWKKDDAEGLDLGGGVDDLEEERERGPFDRDGEEEAALGADGAVDQGTEGLADTGALPRHKWHPHTVKVGGQGRPSFKRGSQLWCQVVN